jgi:hypothetical protein
MLPRALLLCWIAVGASATERDRAPLETVTILSSKGGGKLSAEVKPAPSGPVEVRVSIVDPQGNSRALPPSSVSPDANGHFTGPELPAESRGFLIEVEVIDPATGASLGKNWSIVG